MKKRILLLGIALIVGVMICACGTSEDTEAPLKKTYKSISKYAKKTNDLKVNYDSYKDCLDIGFYSNTNIDKVFNTLSKNIKGKEVGMLYFRTVFNVDDFKKEKICERISKLNPKSIMVFGMEDGFLDCGDQSWTKILPKVDALYVNNAEVFYDYKDADSKKNLESVKKLWLHNDSYLGVGSLPNLEEIAIYATVENDDNRASTQGRVYNQFGSSYSYPTVAPNETVTDEDGKVREVKPAPQPFEFNETFENPEGFYNLKYAKNLKRITIAPCFEQYKLGVNASTYFFGICNVRNDLMFNKPMTNLSDDSYIKIDEYYNSFSRMTKQEIYNIVDKFVSDEVKPVYSKAKKFKKKNKKQKITDKSLVYLAEPDITMYKKKRVYHSNGRVLGVRDLGYKFKLPERAHDYRYFVYAYPTYKYYGKYDKGTKAYTETYWVQVFDLKNKVAYKPLKVGSKKPEQKIRVSGIPAKHAGSVNVRKIYRFIKKLAK